LTELKTVEIESKNPHIKKAYEMYGKIFKELFAARPDKYECMMDIATIAAKKLKKEGKLDFLDVSDEINACSVEVEVDNDGKAEKWLIMYKNETHNHPTEIEPFGGAATCLGGAIRDPLSGRSYVYQAMRVTGASDPREPLENYAFRQASTTCVNDDCCCGLFVVWQPNRLSDGHRQRDVPRKLQGKAA
jgi:Phosphoribosylformylglycinamidine (FGAM) synthase, synthetase domain